MRDASYTGAVETVAGIVLAGTAVFAATNIDDLFLLVAWFAAGCRTRDIVLGQYAGIGALFAASVGASLLALVVPAGQLAWLGVIPVVLGASMLFRTRTEDRVPPAVSGPLQVAAVTVANGADNLGVYVPLFATSEAFAVAVIGGVFAAMTALWCGAARWLVGHREAGAPVRRYGPRAAPYFLIGIGLWILLR